jgi:hypothetical protein
MRPDPTIQTVLGNGPVARTFKQLLDCNIVERKTNDAGWNWPNIKRDSFRFLLIPRFDSPPSEVIRWHADVWKCPNAAEICCAIFGLSDQCATNLAARDVFGRMPSSNQTFDDWSNYVALIPRSAPLADLLTKMTELIPCSVRTWQRHANEASVIPRLFEAISKRDGVELNKVLPTAILQDWDSVCFSHPEFGNPHAYANRIKSWLASVTSSVALSWEQGESLLAPLATSR